MHCHKVRSATFRCIFLVYESAFNICRHTIAINIMYREIPNPEDDLMFSLDEEERSLAYAINDNAEMIYFHHGAQQFVYLIRSDRDEYKEEMNHLKRGIRLRLISAITVGEQINIEGIDLFFMDVRFDNSPCYPYMLLRRRGLYDDAANTPYFFKSQQKRDEIVAYFVSKLQLQDQE